MDNHSKRVLQKMEYKAQLAFLVDLMKKSVIVSQKFEIYEIDFSFSCSTYFEFRFYRKGDNVEILLNETMNLLSSDFDEKATELDRVLNHLLQNGVMPVIYNFYLKNDNENGLFDGTDTL